MSSAYSENVANSYYSYPGNSNETSVSVHPQNNDDINDYSEPLTKGMKSNTKCFKITFDAFKMEILTFLILFSINVIQTTSTSMILDKVCLVHFNYSAEICNNLNNNTEIKSAVEKLATNYHLGYSLIKTVPSAILSGFIGPWSDQYGRKAPMLIAIFGVTIEALGLATCSYFMQSRVEYFFIPALFSGCFGGVITILAVIYSYASDLTAEERRTTKYAFLEMAIGLGEPLGSASGGWIANFVGYPPVFLLSASGFVISFIWVAFLLPETRGLGNEDDSRYKKLFTCKGIKESFETTTKKRPNKGRKQLLLLILSMCIVVTTAYCSGSINFLFVHHQYNWGQTIYSYITAIYSIVGTVTLAAMVPTFKYFKLGDPTLGLIGTTSMIMKFICFGLAWNPILFHFGNILGCVGRCSLFAARSRISKLVSNDDLGKMIV
ncbi:uncharacterized protein LOC129968670 isoform X2 [Argiope bruennichi]|uniref:Proton-coupled folate transporter like protein n=1 Tax=Argiope bruennichi TaxID=94029 RepID=A0A8T0E238_ARGBR|nr:uncharacterized protein LOC129968670 isoform X2 [Argiope bruennichi]KAF8764215.1 Proton-coupled folate transporter like protein [Argiope bruennichi]